MTAELAPIAGESPSVAQWTLGFILVGIAWGFTTPFMRRMYASNSSPYPAKYELNKRLFPILTRSVRRCCESHTEYTHLT